MGDPTRRAGDVTVARTNNSAESNASMELRSMVTLGIHGGAFISPPRRGVRGAVSEMAKVRRLMPSVSATAGSVTMATRRSGDVSVGT